MRKSCCAKFTAAAILFCLMATSASSAEPCLDPDSPQCLDCRTQAGETLADALCGPIAPPLSESSCDFTDECPTDVAIYRACFTQLDGKVDHQLLDNLRERMFALARVSRERFCGPEGIASIRRDFDAADRLLRNFDPQRQARWGECLTETRKAQLVELERFDPTEEGQRALTAREFRRAASQLVELDRARQEYSTAISNFVIRDSLEDFRLLLESNEEECR